jgi:PadR family transcriptional regulator AphA
MSLQNALLGLLSQGDMTGYDLKKMFDDSISNFWYASVSQIYRELNGLEDKGLLSSVMMPQSDRPDRRVYSITPQGRSAFKEWITHFPEEFSRDKRDEFSLRLFFGSSLDDAALTAQFERLAEQKRRQMEEIGRLSKMVDAYAEKLPQSNDGRYWRMILRRAVMSLEATIAWSLECIELLKGNDRNENG